MQAAIGHTIHGGCQAWRCVSVEQKYILRLGKRHRQPDRFKVRGGTRCDEQRDSVPALSHVLGFVDGVMDDAR